MIPHRLSIAIVDDEACVRTALCRVLRSAGIDAEMFASGEDFLESLHSHRPDCVLLDLQMPRLTGFDVQMQLKEIGACVPAIIITCLDSPGAQDRALAGGAADYLSKPVKSKTLLDAVYRAVGQGQPQPIMAR